MPTMVSILTFMSRINIVLSWVEHGKKFYYLGARPDGFGQGHLIKIDTVFSLVLEFVFYNKKTGFQKPCCEVRRGREIFRENSEK